MRGKANHKCFSETSMKINFMPHCPSPFFLIIPHPKMVRLLERCSWKLAYVIWRRVKLSNWKGLYLFIASFALRYEVLFCSRMLWGGGSAMPSRHWISGRSSAKPRSKCESYPSFRFLSVTLHPDSMNRTLSSQGRGSITGHFLGPWICTMRYQLQSVSTMLQWLPGMAAILMPFNDDRIIHPAVLNKMIL